MAYTSVDNSELYFQVKLFSGANQAQSITFDGDENMKPDWVWIKSRNGSSRNHCLYDSVRGVTKRIETDTNIAEDNTAAQLTSFDTDGFTMGIGEADINSGGRTYVSWNWVANGSTTSTNNDGSIASEVSVNSTSGFSIVTYTGTGSATSIGHGLGAKPDWILSKLYSTTGDWNVYHDSFSNQERAKLNTTAAKTTNTSIYASLPTASVINVGSGGDINTDGGSHIFYCFKSVKGFSKFGSYKGNGNDDGVFIYTGFKPAFVITKQTNGGNHWHIHDNKRNLINVVNTQLKADSDAADETPGSGENARDFLSNGFKFRDSDHNNQTHNYIYMAFAESPFVNSKGVPNNAR